MQYAAAMLCVLAVMVPNVSGAQNPPAPFEEDATRPTKWELTPFVGYRAGGEFEDAVTGTRFKLDETPSYGLILNIAHRKNTQYEVYASYQSTRLLADGAFTGDPLFDLDIWYLQGGGTYVFDVRHKVRPYLLATIGATHLSPGPAELNSKTRFSINLGGGVKIFPIRNLGIRLEARWLATALQSNSAIFCGGGTCAVQVTGNGFSQYEANLGLTFAF